MKLQDAIFNWLQIKLVSEARPDDHAAKETLDFFATILSEDHGLKDYCVDSSDAAMYVVQFVKDGENGTRQIPKEQADQLLKDIEANPKYN